MEKNKTTKILDRYLSCRFSAEKERLVQQWIIKESNQKEKEQASLGYWDELDVRADDNTLQAYKRVENKIADVTDRTLKTSNRPLYSERQINDYDKKSVKITLYKTLSRVAAILIPLFFIVGGYHYYTSTKSSITEITAAYGEDKHLFLPDGTEVWVNAGTTIKYPNEFRGEERLVHLDGEAYFSVIKDESRPFIVRSKALSVKVLGTKFNVKAYSGDIKATATLTSGKVEVTTDTKVSKILNPNEQLIFNKATSAIHIAEVLPSETDSWLNGQLIFDNVPLKEIIQTLERRFDITITNKTNIPDSKLYAVKFLKNENLDEIMTILEELTGFTHNLIENKLILTNKN